MTFLGLLYWDLGKSTESVAGGEKGSKGRHRALLPIDGIFSDNDSTPAWTA